MGDGPDGYYHLRWVDVHKATISVALAESGRDGEVRQVEVFENRPKVRGKAGDATEQGRASPQLLLRGPFAVKS
jgi:hypothetical protein